ncbi:PDZ domain-containing protein, partial [Burkholderia sp. SIMBA_045]
RHAQRARPSLGLFRRGGVSESLRESTQGEFGGIGIEVGTQNGQLLVVTPIDDTPASRAGLLSQDIIVAIDGTPTDSLSLQEAVNL